MCTVTLENVTNTNDGEVCGCSIYYKNKEKKKPKTLFENQPILNSSSVHESTSFPDFEQLVLEGEVRVGARGDGSGSKIFNH